MVPYQRMFKKDKKLIVYLRRETLKAYLVDSLGTSQSTGEYSWTSENLEEVLRKIIKQEKSTRARILLDDTLGYLWDLEIPLTEKDEKNYIIQKIAAKIPEVLESQDWDFKEVGQTKEAKIIRVFAPAKEIWKLFTLNCLKAGLEIEAVETVSIALERNKDPVIGLAMKTDLKIKDEKAAGAKPARLMVEVVEEERKTSSEVLDNQGKDKDIVVPSSVRKASETIKEKKSIINKTFVLIVVGMALLTALILGGILVYRNSLNESGLLDKPTPTVSQPSPTEAVAEPSPSIKISDLKIKILNGSGIPGEAGVVKKYLEGLDYQNIQTGNAATFDYKGVQYSIKKALETFKTQLNKDLSAKYTLTDTLKTLDESDAFDVVIIVGKE